MALFKHGVFVDDPWQADPASPRILTLVEWRALRNEPATSNQPLAIRVEPGESLDEIVPDLARFEMIALSGWP